MMVSRGSKFESIDEERDNRIEVIDFASSVEERGK
jgi:hypothetical protein